MQHFQRTEEKSAPRLKARQLLEKELDEFFQREFFEKKVGLDIAKLSANLTSAKSNEEATKEKLAELSVRTNELSQRFDQVKKILNIPSAQDVRELSLSEKMDLILTLFHLEAFEELFICLKRFSYHYQMDASYLAILSSKTADLDNITKLIAMPMQWLMRYETVISETIKKAKNYQSICRAENIQPEIYDKQLDVLQEVAINLKEKITVIDDIILEDIQHKCIELPALWNLFIKNVQFGFFNKNKIGPFNKFEALLKDKVKQIIAPTGILIKSVQNKSAGDESFSKALKETGEIIFDIKKGLEELTKDTPSLQDRGTIENLNFTPFCDVVKDLDTSYSSILRQLASMYFPSKALLEKNHSLENKIKELEAKLEAVEEKQPSNKTYPLLFSRHN